MDFLLTLLTSICGMITALGGFELIKWLYNRRNNSRIVEAQADTEEVKADGAEFDLLKTQIEFLQTQIVAKEKRFADQTDQVRKLTTEVLELTRENGQVRIELETKRCDVKHCPKRQPPTGY